MSVLIIGGIEIAVETLGDFRQTYDERQAVDFRRTADGSGVLRELWSGKLSTRITANGWTPGIDHWDVGQTHVISCVTPRTVNSVTTSVTLPAARRNDADHEPIAFAVVDNELVATTISNLAAINAGSVDTATLVVVAGAAGYQVAYWPKITGAITGKSSSGGNSGNFDWSLEAEEV